MNPEGDESNPVSSSSGGEEEKKESSSHRLSVMVEPDPSNTQNEMDSPHQMNVDGQRQVLEVTERQDVIPFGLIRDVFMPTTSRSVENSSLDDETTPPSSESEKINPNGIDLPDAFREEVEAALASPHPIRFKLNDSSSSQESNEREEIDAANRTNQNLYDENHLERSGAFENGPDGMDQYDEHLQNDQDDEQGNDMRSQPAMQNWDNPSLVSREQQQASNANIHGQQHDETSHPRTRQDIIQQHRLKNTEEEEVKGGELDALEDNEDVDYQEEVASVTKIPSIQDCRRRFSKALEGQKLARLELDKQLRTGVKRRSKSLEPSTRTQTSFNLEETNSSKQLNVQGKQLKRKGEEEKSMPSSSKRRAILDPTKLVNLAACRLGLVGSSACQATSTPHPVVRQGVVESTASSVVSPPNWNQEIGQGVAEPNALQVLPPNEDMREEWRQQGQIQGPLRVPPPPAHQILISARMRSRMNWMFRRERTNDFVFGEVGSREQLLRDYFYARVTPNSQEEIRRIFRRTNREFDDEHLQSWLDWMDWLVGFTNFQGLLLDEY